MDERMQEKMKKYNVKIEITNYDANRSSFSIYNSFHVECWRNIKLLTLVQSKSHSIWCAHPFIKQQHTNKIKKKKERKIVHLNSCVVLSFIRIVVSLEEKKKKKWDNMKCDCSIYLTLKLTKIDNICWTREK